MDLNKISKLTDKEIELIIFLEKCTKGKWSINKKTGLVDIDGDFDSSKEKLKDFKGVRFGLVTGNFCCYNNKLTSLEGAPQKVGEGFYCHNNSLTSLEGAPQEVGGSFDCSYNKLTSLEGAPRKVTVNFCCSYNKLKSLEGAPQEVGWNFDCFNNNLTSLEGAPQEVGGSFNCTDNKLTSLEGAPLVVGRNFNCIYNKLTSLEGAPQEVGENFYCHDNSISYETLKLVWETMQKNKIDYWTALCFIKSKIDSEEWVVMSKGIDDNLDKDAQKGISMLNRFGHFD